MRTCFNILMSSGWIKSSVSSIYKTILAKKWLKIFHTAWKKRNDNFTLVSLSFLLPMSQSYGWKQIVVLIFFADRVLSGSRVNFSTVSCRKEYIFKVQIIWFWYPFFMCRYPLLWAAQLSAEKSAWQWLSPFHSVVRYKLLQIFLYFYGLRHQQPQRKYALLNQVPTCVLNWKRSKYIPGNIQCFCLTMAND